METSTYAGRLEEVREYLGVSLRAWWQKLTETDEYEISYESVRQYHQDREPAVSYLIQVSREFGVTVEWLATGEGARWTSLEDEDEKTFEFVKALDELYPSLEDLGPEAFTGLSQLLSHIRDAAPGQWTNPVQEGFIPLMTEVICWATAPLKALGSAGLGTNQRRAYFHSLIAAIQTIIPAQEKGRTLPEITETWREAMRCVDVYSRSEP